MDQKDYGGLISTQAPYELWKGIGGEKPDFIVKAARQTPLKGSLGLLFFGIIWLGFSSIFVFAFLGPVFMGQEVHFKANGVPTVAGPGNLGPLLMPGIFIGIFVLIGIGMIVAAIYSMVARGSWFAGTVTRLVEYRPNKLKSYDWEQFNGVIEVSGTAQKADITLHMRTGRMVSQKNGPDRYVPDAVYISGVSNGYEIEAVCRKRIKENDPTPPAVSSS